MAIEKIKILIVEDEAIVALELAQALEQDGYEIVATSDNGAEAMEIFRSQEVDIVLMDIHILGNMDGIDTAACLLKHKEVPLIYLTAFTDEATVRRAKSTRPSAFLAKPYNVTNVRLAIEVAIHNFAASRRQATGDLTTGEEILRMNDAVFIKQNYTFVKVLLPDIQYLEAENNYVQLVTKEKKLLLRLSLGLLMEKLRYKPLVRVHRSFAVNMNAIRSFSDQEVELANTSLPIGRSYKEAFLNNFNTG